MISFFFYQVYYTIFSSPIFTLSRDINNILFMHITHSQYSTISDEDVNVFIKSMVGPESQDVYVTSTLFLVFVQMFILCRERQLASYRDCSPLNAVITNPITINSQSSFCIFIHIIFREWNKHVPAVRVLYLVTGV